MSNPSRIGILLLMRHSLLSVSRSSSTFPKIMPCPGPRPVDLCLSGKSSGIYLISSYYNLLSVCAGESQGRNPIGKALVIYNMQIMIQVSITVIIDEQLKAVFFLQNTNIYLFTRSVRTFSMRGCEVLFNDLYGLLLWRLMLGN